MIPGDRIIVHTGHVLPLDGILEEGDVMLNQASLTGESVPVAKRPGAASVRERLYMPVRSWKRETAWSV